MDVLSLLDQKGIDYVHKGGDEYAISCPAQANHSDGQDSLPSFNINIEKQQAHCFSCNFSMNEASLTKWLLGDELDDDQMACMTLRSKLKKLQICSNEELLLEESEEFTMMPPGKPFDREYRGISAETYKLVKAIECKKGRYSNRVCFPIWQKDKLLGVDARALGTEVPKYLRNKGCKAQEWLWPYNLAKEAKVTRVILCEGAYHVLGYLERMKVPEALSVFGANNMTSFKLMLLLELNLDEVIVFPDNDPAGVKLMQTACEMIAPWLETYYIPPEILPDDGRDLGDFSKEEIELFLSQKRRWK